MQARAAEVLAMFGDLAWAQQRMDALSDGQAQRVMFARAVLQGHRGSSWTSPRRFWMCRAGRAFWTPWTSPFKARTIVLVLATHDYEQLAGEIQPSSVNLIEAKNIFALDPSKRRPMDRANGALI